MADISVVSRLVAGIHRDIDLQQNSLVVGSLKVGTSSPAELTKAILEKLISLQDGSDIDSTYHTHDGRYYTQTQIGSASGTSGADLVGVRTTAINHSPASQDVEAYLASIDSALSTAGTTSFADDIFEIVDNADATRKMMFQVSAISASTIRTITMPDEDVDLADVNIAVLTDGSRHMTSDLDMDGFQVLNLATATLASHAVRYDQFQNALSGLDFQPDVNALVADASTTAPGSGLPAAATGQRYILVSGTGSLAPAWGTIAGLMDNDIVQYDGSAWYLAYDVSISNPGALVWDRDTATFQRFDGVSWDEFGGLSGITAGNGLKKTGNTLDLDFSEMSAVTIANNDELAFGDTADNNIVKKITFLDFNAALDHDILINYVANKHVDHSSVSIATAIDSGLSGGGDITATRNLVVDINGQTQKTAPTASDEVMIWSVSDSARRKATVEDLHKNQNVYKEFVAGESFAANTTFAVRFAISGETAGRVYKCDHDASVSNKFYALGLLLSTSPISAGNTVKILISGEHTLGSSDSAFDSGEIGQPVHIKASGAFDAVSQITYSSNQASFRIGYVQTTTKIFLDGSKQLNGIA